MTYLVNAKEYLMILVVWGFMDNLSMTVDLKCTLRKKFAQWNFFYSVNNFDLKAAVVMQLTKRRI